MFIAAVCLSMVAAYYSIVGLAAIFAGAFIPIIIMAGILEASKVITATWLYHNWKITPWLLKTYLTLAVVVLMLITSTGIFGFLSKAHIEQAAASADNTAKIERIDAELSRLDGIIKTAQDKINALESGTVGADATVQSQIDREQARIDQAYARIQPAIDEQNKIIAQASGDNGQAKPYQDELATIDADLKDLQAALAGGDTKRAQAIIGVATDGKFGQQTQASLAQYRAAKEARRQELLKSITDLQKNPASQATITAAQDEIKRLRSQVETQIKPSQDLIDKLRGQLGTVNTADVTTQLDELNAKIKTSQDDKDNFSQQKYTLESDLRKLEVEVGPIKYLAQLIYGQNTNKDMLEAAVRGMILLLIFVFDPLAVLMLIAANQGLISYSQKSVRHQTDNVIRTNLDLDDANVPSSSKTVFKEPVHQAATINVTKFVSRFAKLTAQREPNTTQIGNESVLDLDTNLKSDSEAVSIQPTVDDLKTADNNKLSVDNAEELQFNNDSNQAKMKTEYEDMTDPTKIGQIFGTRDFIDKLAKAHAARLQKRFE